ncbi:MAG TPA: 23S rRNA (adenine(2503)-C(2))-methyltransferase RlmN [Chthoniobacterales bacterium]|nr:23S rRNA (adenine(2503)-C(2))-methyltransferase RlmN [Chthoniobacterales bacterium]
MNLPIVNCDIVTPPISLQESKPQALHGLLLEELVLHLEAMGAPVYAARQVMSWVYNKRVESCEAMHNLSLHLREQLAAAYSLALPEVVTTSGSHDTTQKFLLRLSDGEMIETVLIPASPALYGEASDRRTLCVSTQVGCAYGCKFCASGLDGWKRNLRTDEIVAQILLVEKISGQRINNLVFMGMGEPLANYDNLVRALTILNAPWGVGLGSRKMTVSTSGLVPQIRQLADRPQQIRLAISLHGATDAVRVQIMPVNKRYPLAELMEACAYYVERKKQLLTFEYILIAGVNDQQDQAELLASHAQRLRAKVNLIPYNNVEGLSWQRPEESVQRRFLSQLRSRGVAATIRREKGHDIDAACGQLRRKVSSQDKN